MKQEVLERKIGWIHHKKRESSPSENIITCTDDKASKGLKQKLKELKTEIKKHAITVRNFKDYVF